MAADTTSLDRLRAEVERRKNWPVHQGDSDYAVAVHALLTSGMRDGARLDFLQAAGPRLYSLIPTHFNDGRPVVFLNIRRARGSPEFDHFEGPDLRAAIDRAIEAMEGR